MRSRRIFHKLCLAFIAVCLIPLFAAGEQITVLTYNVWDIISARYRPARAKLIAPAIAALDPDIVALEEAFNRIHRGMIIKGLEKAGYNYAAWRYFPHPTKYGTGLMLISKFPVIKTESEFYTTAGPALDFERFGGRGIVHAVLETPEGPLDFYFTHIIARMSPIFDEQGNYIPGDDKQTDRILQALQMQKFIAKTRTPGARCMIAAGDFNVSPEMLEYHYLVAVNQFRSSFEELHPGQNPSTFSVENMFVKDDFSRIDHIFYRNYDGTEGFFVRPISSEVVMKETLPHPLTGKPLNLSDHYGLLSVFEVLEPQGLHLAKEMTRAIYGDLKVIPSGPHDPQSPAQWYALADEYLEHALANRLRTSPLIVPLTEVIVNLSQEGDETLELTAQQREALNNWLANKSK